MNLAAPPYGINLLSPISEVLNLLLSISKALTILLSFSEASHFHLSISEVSANHVSFISTKIFSLLPNHFRLAYFTSICCISSSITLTDLIYYLKCTSYVSHFITQFLLHIFFLLTQLGE